MRQYKTLMLVMFFLCIICLSIANASIRNYSLLGRCFYIDPGHGGRDSGAISHKFLEKDMNLLLSTKLANELFKRGAFVYLTRDGDYDLASSTINRKRNDLYSRVKLINKSKCDMYISIHLNSSPSPKWSGIQTFYSSTNKNNKIIAQIITNNMKKNISNIRDYKKENDYYMYSKIKIPGVLIEAGFISNSRDNYNIRQNKYQDLLINSIANGISEYYNK